jgi:hypothetical protein
MGYQKFLLVGLQNQEHFATNVFSLCKAIVLSFQCFTLAVKGIF